MQMQGAAEFQFAVDPSETKEAFILEPFGPVNKLWFISSNSLVGLGWREREI